MTKTEKGQVYFNAVANTTKPKTTRKKGKKAAAVKTPSNVEDEDSLSSEMDVDQVVLHVSDDQEVLSEV